MYEQLELKSFLETQLKQHYLENAVERVISVTESAAVPPGENFMSIVRRIVAVVRLSSGKVATRHLIWKELPEGSMAQAFVTDLGLFLRELTCYSDVLPVFEDLLEEKGYPDELLWPRCYYIKSPVRIIMEDLKPLGYKMANKFEGLDLEHSILVMQALGLFHSFSFLAKDYPALTLDVFSKSYVFNSENYIREFSMALNKLLLVLKSWGEEWDLAAEGIRNLIPRLKDKFDEMFHFNESRLNVFNHGDSWTNNFLFKYNQYTGVPEKVRLVDFQLSHFTTPALDLTCFLALSPNLNVRRHHVDRLIQAYHESLTLNMNRFQVETRRPSLSEIRDEIQRLKIFHLFLVLFIAPKSFLHEGGVKPFDFEEFLRRKKDDGCRKEDEINRWFDFNNDRCAPILKIVLKQAMENDIFR